ncbi:MAG TPA: M48 family metallopeptidase [Polyangiales bacterium]|nr:M48 family metallopeptidase [Polyangiales bacterium]
MPSLFRAYALPVLWMFAVPAFALWFAGHAQRQEDGRFLELVEAQLNDDGALAPEERAGALRFYREHVPSVACLSADPESADYRESLGELCSDMQQFQGLRWVALASIALGLGSALFALGCALTSLLSRPAQYLSFLVGWSVLKVVGALQALLQGACLVFLSYWMTALWLERYSVKLVLVAALLAAFALWKVLAAIFKRPEGGVDVEGELIEEAQAPEFWQRIRTLCAKLDTAPPSHVIAGIDDNFFVTEGSVRVGDQTLQGRTLYVSLSLLRILERSEADAVLAHEMAHFHGGDTTHGKRMSPMLARFQQYLAALHEGVITIPIFHFMLGYYGLFSLSLGRASREREFSADGTAARLVSKRDIAHSLIKIGAYASYRGRVEEALFEQDAKHEQVHIAKRVANGFSGYATTEKVHFDLHEAVTPHPFDSHPRLSERLARVQAQIEKEHYGAILLAPVTGTWVDAIDPANDIEARLWSAYEQRFQAAHELALAFRYLPENDEERAHVERFFPAQTFAGKEQHPAVVLDFAKLAHAEWELSLADVRELAIEKRLFKRYLDLKLHNGGLFGGKRSICLDRIVNPDELVEAIARYHGRHEAAHAKQAA